MTPKTYTVAELRHSTETGQFVRLEELAALREDMIAQRNHYRTQLADAKNADRLQIKLAAAEQWNAELVELLTPAQKAIEQFMPNIGKCFNIDFALLNQTLAGLGRALEPTESGASE